MNLINQSAFLKALGWALFDSIWQIGVLWLVYIVITGNGKRFLARQRHGLAFLSLMSGLIWFVITLIQHYQASPDYSRLAAAMDLISTGSLVRFFDPALPFFSLAYLVIIPYLLVRFAGQYRHAQDLFKSNLHKADPELRIFLSNMAERMGIKRKVSIWLSARVDTPLTVGFWKPIILLPIASINNLTLKQAEAIILHELYHIKRHDYVVNLLIACMDILFFFNPFVRTFTNILKRERENSCDDMVLQFQYDPTQYANALLLLEKNRVKVAALSIAATGKNKRLLLDRVKRILNKKVNPTINYRLIALFVVALIVAIAGALKQNQVEVDGSSEIGEVASVDYSITSAHQRFFSSESRRPALDKTRNAGSVDLSEVVAAIQLQKVNEPAAPIEVEAEEREVVRVDSYLPSFVEARTSQRDFSIPDDDLRAAEIASEVIDEVRPYIPSSSFSYHILEDTTLPKKYVYTASEIKALEAREKALKALEELDWLKLEKDLSQSGKKVNIVQLQSELRKAIAEVDWKKINQECEGDHISQQAQFSIDKTLLVKELAEYERARKFSTQKAEKNKNVIVNDRLNCTETKENKATRKKTVVVI